MYDFISLALILTSITVIIAIVIRKFPALANLDVHNIPAEKEAQFKERILGNRLKRMIQKWTSRVNKVARPSGQALGNLFKWLYGRLIEMKDVYKDDRREAAAGTDNRIALAFEAFEEYKSQNDLAGAEKKLIEIIGLDPKNLKAFRALAQLYFDRKEFEEAKQTFEHILKLNEGDEEAFDGLANIASQSGNLDQAKDEYLKSLKYNKQRGQTYYSLALVYESMKNPAEALKSIRKALSIESNNPRYLDMKLRISIMIKDKEAALRAYNKLKTVNPDNQKLGEFKAEIDAL